MFSKTKSNKYLFIAALILFTGLFFNSTVLHAANDELKGGILDKNVNSDDEDYGAYVIQGTTEDTLYFTSSRQVPHQRLIALRAEMFFSTRSADFRNSNKPINEGWSPAKQIVVDATRIAQFTRGSQAISSDRIIFAAEKDLSTKTAVGTSFLLDLWQMTRRSDGFSLPEPLTTVNDPDAWNSQPALSSDGKVLYFVSNRAGGKGGLDIWYSVRDASGNWTKPLLAPNINTPGDEVSPQCGNDGKFYFSSNWDYKNNAKGNTGKDIYRADYVLQNDVQVPVNPILLDEAIRKDAEAYGLTVPQDLKYNSDADDEFPFITPDRKTIFITSNRSSEFKKRNLYAFSLPKSKISVLVNVEEQTLDSHGNLLIPAAPKIGLQLTLVDSATGLSQEITSGEKYEVDADKTYQIKFSKFIREECYQNKIEGPEEISIKTFRPFGLDTLFIRDMLVTRQKVEIKPIVFHSTDTLPYFVTGYWYPNTSENLALYRQREASGFFNSTGFVDSSGHDYSKIAPVIDSVFDANIYQPLEKLLPGFQDFCHDTLYLKVTIHGYTDPRGLSGGQNPYRPVSLNKHIYPDDSVTIGVDEDGKQVRIPTGIDMWKQSWPVDPNNSKGSWIHLTDDGENGNILLSKLRAYYTFVTFDRAMRQRSPIYAQMRDEGRVVLDAEGFGIDKDGFAERHLKDDPQSRRIEIYLDILRPEELKYSKRMKGGQIATLMANKKDMPVPAQKFSATVTTEKTPEVTMEVKEKAPASETPEKNTEPTPMTPDKQTMFDFSSTSKPLPPPEDKPKDIPVSVPKCYSIEYNAYSNEGDAQKAKTTLEQNAIDDVKIVPYYNEFGSLSNYRLRSGCFQSTQEAVINLKQNAFVQKLINVDKRPVIVR